jgi:hypothetical protein
MYKSGEVKVKIKCDAGDDCDNWDEIHQRTAHGCFDSPVGTIFLPHSCDEWVIGGTEQIKELILDLLMALSPEERGAFINESFG